MSNGMLPSSLVGKRKRKIDPNPNPLFSKWLAEWRDEAREKGWKSEYIYSKALSSLKKYPLPLLTGKECKILQHFGDKICKMLDDRLLKHKQEKENLALLEDFDGGFPSASSLTSHPHFPTTVHEVSDDSDEDNGSVRNPKSVVHSNSNTAQASEGNRKVVSTLGQSSSNTAQAREGNRKMDSTLGQSSSNTAQASEGNRKVVTTLGQSTSNTAQVSEGNRKVDSTLGQNRSKQTSSRKHALSRSAVENVDLDEDVSFTGQTSSVKVNILGLDDDDILALPRLPDLDKGGEDDTEMKLSSGKSSVHIIGDVGPADATAVAQVTHGVSDSEGDEAGHVLPPQRPGVRGGVRQPREYIPAYRSGPYAILLTLFRHAQDPNFRGYMTKAELCQAAQPLADKSFTVADPGSRYTAWSSVSILIKKAFMIKESSPAKYHLTDQGYELAHRLEEVERRNAAEQCQTGRDRFDNDWQGADSGTARGDDTCGSLVTAAETGVMQPVARHIRRSPQKESRPHNTDLESSPTRSTDFATSVTSTEHPKQQFVGYGQEVNERAKEDNCIVVEDCDADESDNSDDLPALTLPSLACRLKPSLSSSLSGSKETSGHRRLQYWYVAEDDKLVSRKHQACVEIDEAGVRFLVKINYQHLLQSGSQYRLDVTRPLGDDFVFAYLSDTDCYEEAQPPVHTSTGSSATATTTAAPESTATVRSATASTKSRPVHDISDSDIDSQPVSSMSDAISGITSHDFLLSHNSARSAGLPSRSATAGVPSFPSAASNHNAKTTVKTAAECKTSTVSKFRRVPSYSSSVGSGDSGKSVASDPVADFVLWPGTFEVVLCVDNREFYGSQSSSKSLLPDLIKNGVTCDLRLLNVGDLLWVAREKMPTDLPLKMPVSAEHLRRQELVLNYVVERKRMDDLVSSMIGGRLKEQKFRLKHSGLQEKIILVESYGSIQHFSISEDRIKQAIANTEIIDGFTVKQTRDAKETAAYLTVMTRYLQSYYQNKTLRSCTQETVKELGLRFDINDAEQMLMPFDHFNQASLKNKPLTVTELFAKQLIQLWGMSAEKAKAVVDRYPTPTSLFEAYAACASEKEKDSLLANLKYGKNLRNLGIALSRNVAQLYTSRALT